MVALNFELFDLDDMKIRFFVFRASGVMPPSRMFASTVLKTVSGKREFSVIGMDGKKVRVCLELQADGQYKVTVCGGDATTGGGNSLVVRLLPTYDSPVNATAVDALPPACEARDAVGFFLERLLPDSPFPGYDSRQTPGGPIVRRYSLARLTGSADDYFCFDCDDDGRRLHLHLRVPGSFSLGQVAPIEGWDCDLLTVRLLDGTSSLDAMQRKKRDANGRKVIELAFDAARDCGETVQRVMDVVRMLSVCLAAAAGSDDAVVGGGVGGPRWE